MSMNNVVPSYILRDPEKLASFLDSYYGKTEPSVANDKFHEQLVRNAEAVKSIREEIKVENEQQKALETWMRTREDEVEWVPEDETPDASTMDELGMGNLPEVIYAVVDPKFNELDKKNALYSTLKGARAYAASRWSVGGAYVVKGEVKWQKL